MLYQRTLARQTSVVGIGLHSGKKVKLTLYPAPANSGIVFRRTDISNASLIKATSESVRATGNATTLGNNDYEIHTVEHLLAALYGLGIDNVYCEVNGPEIPIMDGSSISFVYLLREAGVSELDSEKKFLVILSPIKVKEGDKWAEISPCDRLVIDSTISFSHPLIKTQREVFDFSCESFIQNISRARTFGLLKDVDSLKRRGLIRGGSLDNCVVLDDFKVMNSDGLRFSNEFVKHKLLDTLGDLALLGHEVVGKVTTYKSGHHLHNVLCQKILNEKNSYKLINASELKESVESVFELPASLLGTRPQFS